MFRKLSQNGWTGKLLFQCLNWWYYLCNQKFLDYPPNFNLNNIIAPMEYDLIYDPDIPALFCDIKPVFQRPVKLLILMSKFLSAGSWVCHNFAICDLIDYVPGQRINLMTYYRKKFKYWHRDGRKVYVELRFIDPETGFHSLGVWWYIIIDK